MAASMLAFDVRFQCFKYKSFSWPAHFDFEVASKSWTTLTRLFRHFCKLVFGREGRIMGTANGVPRFLFCGCRNR